MIKAKTSTSPKKTTTALKKAPTPVKKTSVVVEPKAVIQKKGPILKKEMAVIEKETVLKSEPVIHTVGQRLQTAEGWKRSVVAKKISESRKTKKT
jgi:hypothetical protein